MELTNEFEVPVALAEAWELLTDLERIAPCLPGATLTGVEGDEHQGTVKVKVGPITAQYRGTARIVDRDDATHTALLEATGRDTKGQGTASAAIRAELAPAGEHATHVSLRTDLSISGKVAQFGGRALGEVSTKLLGEFVANLERDVLSGLDATSPGGATAGDMSPGDTSPGGAPTGTSDESSAATTPGATAPARPAPREAEPIDLLATAGAPIGKRLVPVVVVLGLAVAAICLLRRRRR